MNPVTYRRILLPLDASLLAEQAVPHALAQARAQGAGLHLVQVVDPVDQGPPAFYNLVERFRQLLQPGQVGEALEGWHDAAADYLEAVAADLREAGAPEVTIAVLEGSRFELIGEEATKQGCDLIVIATHGRTGFDRVVMGSVAEHIVQHTHDAAVLIVRPEMPAGEGSEG